MQKGQRSMQKGQRISFDGRNGTVVGEMPNGMIDIRFDDAMGRVERRAEDRLSSPVRENPVRRNPRLPRAPRARPNGQREQEREKKARERATEKDDAAVVAKYRVPDLGQKSQASGFRSIFAQMGAGFYTREDPPRLSTSHNTLGGNPIDGTAYYISVMNDSASKYHWVTEEEVSQAYSDWLYAHEQSNEEIPTEENWFVTTHKAKLEDATHSVGVFLQRPGDVFAAQGGRGIGKVQSQSERPPPDAFFHYLGKDEIRAGRKGDGTQAYPADTKVFYKRWYSVAVEREKLRKLFSPFARFNVRAPVSGGLARDILAMYFVRRGGLKVGPNGALPKTALELADMFCAMGAVTQSIGFGRREVVRAQDVISARGSRPDEPPPTQGKSLSVQLREKEGQFFSWVKTFDAPPTSTRKGASIDDCRDPQPSRERFESAERILKSLRYDLDAVRSWLVKLSAEPVGGWFEPKQQIQRLASTLAAFRAWQDKLVELTKITPAEVEYSAKLRLREPTLTQEELNVRVYEAKIAPPDVAAARITLANLKHLVFRPLQDVFDAVEEFNAADRPGLIKGAGKKLWASTFRPPARWEKTTDVPGAKLDNYIKWVIEQGTAFPNTLDFLQNTSESSSIHQHEVDAEVAAIRDLLPLIRPVLRGTRELVAFEQALYGVEQKEEGTSEREERAEREARAEREDREELHPGEKDRLEDRLFDSLGLNKRKARSPERVAESDAKRQYKTAGLFTETAPKIALEVLYRKIDPVPLYNMALERMPPSADRDNVLILTTLLAGPNSVYRSRMRTLQPADRAKLRAKLIEMIALTQVYRELKGTQLVGSLSSPGVKTGLLDQAIDIVQGTIGLRAVDKGQQFTIFKTYNPVLFQYTRLFWPARDQNVYAGFLGLLFHPDMLNAIDTVGRYGAWMYEVQYAAAHATTDDDVVNSLYALVGTPIKLALSKDVRAHRHVLRDPNFAPFRALWPLKASLQAAAKAEQDIINDPIAGLKQMRFDVELAAVNTSYSIQQLEEKGIVRTVKTHTAEPETAQSRRGLYAPPEFDYGKQTTRQATLRAKLTEALRLVSDAVLAKAQADAEAEHTGVPLNPRIDARLLHLITVYKQQAKDVQAALEACVKADQASVMPGAEESIEETELKRRPQISLPAIFKWEDARGKQYDWPDSSMLAQITEAQTQKLSIEAELDAAIEDIDRQLSAPEAPPEALSRWQQRKFAAQPTPWTGLRDDRTLGHRSVSSERRKKQSAELHEQQTKEANKGKTEAGEVGFKFPPGAITRFRDTAAGDFSFLSNFYTSPVEFDNNVYGTVEQAFQAAKTHDPRSLKPSPGTVVHTNIVADLVLARLTDLRNRPRGVGYEASIRQKKNDDNVDAKLIRPNWDDIKLDAMLDLLKKKFSDPVIAEQLKATGDRLLIDVNDYGETFWGVDERGNGQNMLGVLLMKIRSALQKHAGPAAPKPSAVKEAKRAAQAVIRSIRLGFSEKMQPGVEAMIKSGQKTLTTRERVPVDMDNRKLAVGEEALTELSDGTEIWVKSLGFMSFDEMYHTVGLANYVEGEGLAPRGTIAPQLTGILQKDRAWALTHLRLPAYGMEWLRDEGLGALRGIAVKKLLLLELRPAAAKTNPRFGSHRTPRKQRRERGHR